MAQKSATLISISGVDGSGKTSIIDGVRVSLDNAAIDNRYVWLRYNHYLTKFLLAFCKYTGFTRYEYFEGARVVYHEFYRSRIISWLFVLLTWIDTCAASVIRVYVPRLFSKNVIICDRWIFDIMVDLEVDTRLDFSDGTRLNRFFKLLLPRSALCFVVSRDIENVRKMREESMHDKNFSVRHQLYGRHGQDERLIVVDNNGTIEKSVETILSCIDKSVHGICSDKA